jgi:hypothetical protein
MQLEIELIGFELIFVSQLMNPFGFPVSAQIGLSC